MSKTVENVVSVVGDGAQQQNTPAKEKKGQGKGKGKEKGKRKGGKGEGEKGKKSSRSVKSGLIYPVGRVQRYLKKGRFANRVSPNAAIYLAACLEYMASEIMELSGNCAKENKRLRISPRHILLGIRNDAELNKLLNNVRIASGGVVPNIHSVLIPDTKKKKKNATTTAATSTTQESHGGETPNGKENPAQPVEKSKSKKSGKAKGKGKGKTNPNSNSKKKAQVTKE